MKFLVDSSLGRLSTWLRILGYNAIYYRGEADRSFLRRAEKEGRTVLTRRKDILARKHPGIVLFVENDHVEDQLIEVLGKLDLKPVHGRLFSLCLRCNEPLQEASPDEVQPLVPDYVFLTQREFRVCRKCHRVYWPGTHRERALSVLRKALNLQGECRMT